MRSRTVSAPRASESEARTPRPALEDSAGRPAVESRPQLYNLYIELGSQLTSKQAFRLQPSELAERGRRWFAAQSASLSREVCGSVKVRELVENDAPEVLIVTAIADIVASLLLPVSP